MWLLDVNLPNGLRQILQSFGQESETTAYRGWRDLGNGRLAEVAYKAGFRAILTRDRLFADSAEKALQAYPELAIVVIRLPQPREATYIDAFKGTLDPTPD